MALVAGIALQQLADARQQSNELAAMLTAQREAISLLSSSATEVLTMSATEDGEGIGGRVFLSGDGGQAAVLMNGLADTGKSIYTLWLIDGGVEEPVTDFGPDESGLAVLSIPKVEADTTIAVTLEPRAGNQKPEGPVLAVAFAA